MITTDFKQGCAWQPLPGSLGQQPGIGKADASFMLLRQFGVRVEELGIRHVC